MVDEDERARKAKHLAGALLDAMQSPGEPADDPEKDELDRVALEDYYRRTGQAKDHTARARTTVEMQFAASLLPCPHCGTMEPTQLDLIGSGDSWSLVGACSQCHARRAHAWRTEGHPLHGKYQPFHLGDERPSQIVRIGQFVRELDRLLPLVADDPTQLDHRPWRASLAALHRARTCLLELLKFVPANMQIVPDTKLADDERRDRTARPHRYRRPALQAELDRLVALHQRYIDDAPRIWALEEQASPQTPARGAIDRETLQAHETWLRAGRQGDGRLDVVGAWAKQARLGGVRFTGARLERVDFRRAVLQGADMTDCELVDLCAVEAACTSLVVARATIIAGTFERSDLRLAVFDGASIERTAFTGADLDRSTWRGAVATDASFHRAVLGNAWLDDGTFRRCDFRDADFRLLTQGIRATTAAAVFEDCDLRGTRWDGRDLSGATFVRCRLAGIAGRCSAIANVRIEAADVSPEGDGSRIATADDVLRGWSG